MEEARLEAIRGAELVAKNENGKGNRSCHPYKHLITLQMQRPACCPEACLSSKGLPVVQRPACRPEACLSSRGLPVVQRPTCRPEAHLSSRGPPVVQRPTCRPEAHLSSRGPPVVQRPTCRPEAHLSSGGPPVVQRPTCRPEAHLSSEAYLSSRRCHPRRRVARHSPKASFREDNGSHDVLGFNITIPIDQVKFAGIFGDTPKQEPGRRRGLKSLGTTSHHEFFGTHSQKHSTVVKISIITKRLCEEIVSGSIDTPLFSRSMPWTTREGHSDCVSAGSRIRGQLGIQTLHSKDPNAARQDHHLRAVDEATTGAPHHYVDRWAPKLG